MALAPVLLMSETSTEAKCLEVGRLVGRAQLVLQQSFASWASFDIQTVDVNLRLGRTEILGHSCQTGSEVDRRSKDWEASSGGKTVPDPILAPRKPFVIAVEDVAVVFVEGLEQSPWCSTSIAWKLEAHY